jgi:hypothetical protein
MAGAAGRPVANPTPRKERAALQHIQADYVRALAGAGDSPQKAQDEHRRRLVQFVGDNPQAAEAPAALVEAGQLSEAVGKADDARRCYRYAAGHYAGRPAARKAWAALWKLGMAGESPELRLPLLFAEEQSGHCFDLRELRGMVAVVYFWSGASGAAEQHFRALKAVADRHPRGVEVVFVNADATRAKGQAYLTGRQAAGTHLFLPGGLGSPHAFVLDADGKVVQGCLQASAVEPVVSSLLPNHRR